MSEKITEPVFVPEDPHAKSPTVKGDDIANANIMPDDKLPAALESTQGKTGPPPTS